MATMDVRKFAKSIATMNWHQQDRDGENTRNDSETCCLHSKLTVTKKIKHYAGEEVGM